MPHTYAGFGGLIVFLLGLFVFAGGIAGSIVFLVAMWRWMRAHERVAERLGEIAEALQARRGQE
jgi:hypothetical protein